MRRARLRRTITLRSIAMNVAGAIVAPIAMVANEVLPHPIVAHAIAAPRRVLCSSSLGRISYYEDSGASGLPVLLLHDVAIPGSASALRAVFDELRRDRSVVVPDLLGHGFSQRRGKMPFSREEHIRFVEEMLDDVSRRYGATIDVVAVGTTCEITAAAIVRSSRQVRSLVMVGPSGFDPGGPWLPRRLRATLARGAERLRDPNVVAEVYDALRVPTCFVYDGDERVRSQVGLLVAGRASFRHEQTSLDRPDAMADALGAFWRTLAVKPELRLIRGEKPEGAVTAIRRGPATATRRR
jgi:pimeloyl-ACP methyl ester carboxylesterase